MRTIFRRAEPSTTPKVAEPAAAGGSDAKTAADGAAGLLSDLARQASTIVARLQDVAGATGENTQIALQTRLVAFNA